jgi:hypothetical protein
MVQSTDFGDLDHCSGAPAAALPSAQAHPCRAINGFLTGGNIRNNFSKCGADDFH